MSSSLSARQPRGLGGWEPERWRRSQQRGALTERPVGGVPAPRSSARPARPGPQRAWARQPCAGTCACCSPWARAGGWRGAAGSQVSPDRVGGGDRVPGGPPTPRRMEGRRLRGSMPCPASLQSNFWDLRGAPPPRSLGCPGLPEPDSPQQGWGGLRPQGRWSSGAGGRKQAQWAAGRGGPGAHRGREGEGTPESDGRSPKGRGERTGGGSEGRPGEGDREGKDRHREQGVGVKWRDRRTEKEA